MAAGAVARRIAFLPWREREVDLPGSLARAASRHWPGGWARGTPGRPLVTFTFDDFRKSAWVNGGPLLARFGAKATFYVAGGFEGRTIQGIRYYDRSDLVAAHADDHEIACHTYSHYSVPKRSSADLDSDIERNGAFLRNALGNVHPVSFAYPYGDVSPRSRSVFMRRFTSCRSVHAGLNKGRMNLGALNAVTLYNRPWEIDHIDRWIRRAKDERAWLIFLTHDVDDDPPAVGTTPALLEYALAATRRADIEILPMRSALRCCLSS
jgi:peptidoglycan/xylan/chitin deacetylase (PgdA/CDA1 family)